MPEQWEHDAKALDSVALTRGFPPILPVFRRASHPSSSSARMNFGRSPVPCWISICKADLNQQIHLRVISNILYWMTIIWSSIGGNLNFFRRSCIASLLSQKSHQHFWPLLHKTPSTWSVLGGTSIDDHRWTCKYSMELPQKKHPCSGSHSSWNFQSWSYLQIMNPLLSMKPSSYWESSTPTNEITHCPSARVVWSQPHNFSFTFSMNSVKLHHVIICTMYSLCLGQSWLTCSTVKMLWQMGRCKQWLNMTAVCLWFFGSKTDSPWFLIVLASKNQNIWTFGCIWNVGSAIKQMWIYIFIATPNKKREHCRKALPRWC